MAVPFKRSGYFGFHSLARRCASAIWSGVMCSSAMSRLLNAHQRGGDVAGWLPLLAETQTAIEAVEAAMRESLMPG